MPSLLGNKPNQVSTNGDLGTLAFQDSNAVNLTGGTAVIDNLTADSINLRIDHDLSNISPSLLLDFANTEALDPRITFTRASTATFYDGRTTAKAEENLLVQSQDFTAAGWGVAGASTTANTTAAPDGTTTADTLTENTSNSSHEIFRIFSGTSGLVYAWSGYVKANGRTRVRFRCQATSVVYDVNYDLTAVTTTNIAGTGTATITDVGNGWYRITAIATATASGNAYWQLNLLDASSNLTYTGNGTSGVFLWGAQLEQRSAVSAYTPTTTAPITNYIPALRTAQAGQARFDHAPLTGESLGLLIEEQRTNLITYSDDFANAAWSKTRSSITSNTIVAPDGTLTGDKLVEDSSTNSHHIVQFMPSCISGTAYTFSLHLKAAERSFAIFTFSAASSVFNGAAVYFNLSAGTVGTTGAGITASIQSVGNGWYRCSATQTAAATASGAVVVGTATADGTNSYTGNGFAGLYIWGNQQEAGAFATSYIPTVASQVTRSSDAASMTGTNFSSWYNADEGTLYADFASPSGVNAYVATMTTVAGVRNSGSFILNRTTANGAFVFGRTAGGVNYDTGTTFASGVLAGKIAGAYTTTIAKGSANGSSVLSSSATNIPQFNFLYIGSSIDFGGNINGTMKKLAFYPKSLPNAELVEMTS
jgi:hypothetical protein